MYLYKGGEVGQNFYKVKRALLETFIKQLVVLSTVSERHVRVDFAVEFDSFTYDNKKEGGKRYFTVDSESEIIRLDSSMDADYIRGRFEQAIDRLTRPEAIHYDFFRDSGVIVEGETGYYSINVMVLDLLPPEADEGEVARDDGQGQEGDGGDEPIEGEVAAREAKVKTCLASRFFAFVLFYAIREHKKPGKTNLRDAFMAENFMFDDVYEKVDPSSIFDFIAKYPQIFEKFRWVFLTTYGNVYYIHNPDKVKTKFIEYDGTQNMWRYVFKVRQRFCLQRNKLFCSKCLYFHGIQRCYSGKSTYKIADRYNRFKYPTETRMNVYADWESYIEPETKIHRPAALGMLILITSATGEKFHQMFTKVGGSYSEYGEFIVETIYDHLPYVHCRARLFICPHCNSESESSYCYKGETAYCHWCWKSIFGNVRMLFHNSTGYDNAHTFKALESYKSLIDETGNYEPPLVIAKSVNKLESIVFEFKNHLFLSVKDSAKHLTASLDSLSKMLSPEQLVYTTKEIHKAPFPYDWFDSLEKLSFDIPRDQESWYNELTNSYGDFEKAVQVYDLMGFTKFEDYLRYYLDLDVTLLADVFENYIVTLKQAWNVNPLYFHGMPSAGYYAARQMMGGNEYIWCSLPKTKDVFDMYWQNIRGGITNSIKRRQEKGSGQILYFDVNSLYGSVMANFSFPIGRTIRKIEPFEGQTYLDMLFAFLSSDEYTTGQMGCHAFVSYDVDKFYHDSMPLPYAERKEGNGLSNNFYPVEHQLHSGFRIQQLVSFGYHLIGCDGVFVFDYAPKYQNYIRTNMRLRAEAIAKNDQAGSTTFKLANNAVYGKTCENPRKYSEFIVSDDSRAVEFCTSARTVDTGISPIFTGIRPQQDVTTQKNPWDGFEVLERSKEIFYDGIFRFLQFPDTELLYVDTDSCLIYNPSSTFYEDLKKFEHTAPIICEDKTFGLWQLEFPPDKIIDFVSTTQKCYFLEFADGDSMKKHKGIQKQTELTKEDYLAAIYDKQSLHAEQIQLTFDSCEVRTRKFEKLALSSKNNKRTILFNGVNTVPFGYDGTKYDLGGAGTYSISRDPLVIDQ